MLSLVFLNMLPFLLLLISCFFSNLFCMEVEDGLVSVALIYRHGDRPPIKTYPTDPYSNSSYWPVGFGQLTNTGKMQMFELGRYFRRRYRNFLSEQYSQNEVYILSTDVDRTLMSAQANLAGLFPPKTSQLWNKDLNWQPIPVHTTPEVEDNILRMKVPCEKFSYLLRQLLKSPEFLKIDKENHELYAYLNRYSGMEVASISDLERIFSTLTVETIYNLTLPDWTTLVYPNEMAPWAHLAFALKCYTPDLARLRAGPLLNHIFHNFLKVTRSKGYKFVAYSAHDSTVANILTALNLFDYHYPPYASTIFFELRYLNSSYYVNILYKNTSVPQEMTLDGCEFLCPLDKFRKIVKPLLITPQQWKRECFLYQHSVVSATFCAVTVIVLVLMFVLVCSCILISRIRNKMRQRNYTILTD